MHLKNALILLHLHRYCVQQNEYFKVAELSLSLSQGRFLITSLIRASLHQLPSFLGSPSWRPCLCPLSLRNISSSFPFLCAFLSVKGILARSSKHSTGPLDLFPESLKLKKNHINRNHTNPLWNPKPAVNILGLDVPESFAVICYLTQKQKFLSLVASSCLLGHCSA